MSVERRIDAFLQLAVADLDAAEVLARVGNHYAAYHVHQAIEKLVKALLLHRDIEAGTEHRLEVLVDRLPATDAWRARLETWLPYSAYATTYRYPTPGGRIPTEPPASTIVRDVVALREILRVARTEVTG